MRTLQSAFFWVAIVFLMIIWLPLLFVIKTFDRNPTRYITGKWFRKLGKAITALNPAWKVRVEGQTDFDDRKPYVMVCNHLSNADIPVISNLSCEMKWVSKKELFTVPVTGWMMSWAKDISVDRKADNRGAAVYKQSSFFLDNDVSIIYFPEGTRSKSGKLNKFARGAFDIAIRKKVDILPMVIDGTQNCLPKNTWKFGKADSIRLKVLPPISTSDLKKDDVPALIDTVRGVILKELASMRGIPEQEVDGMVVSKSKDQVQS